jgi:hypothetical protein
MVIISFILDGVQQRRRRVVVDHHLLGILDDE